MLLLKEVAVWIGFGPFEVFVHSLGSFILSLLITLKVESAINSSWHTIFIPLYTALLLDAYYNAVLITRMTLYAVENESNRLFSALYAALTIVRVALLTYLEIQTASVLNMSADIDALIPPLTLVFVYLGLRFFLLSRTVPNNTY